MEYKNIIDSNLLSGIFNFLAVIVLFHILKKNIMIGILSIIVFIIIFHNTKIENLDNEQTTETIKILNSVNILNLNFERFPNHLDIDEHSHKITKLALKDDTLRKMIDEKILQIYGIIITNDKLKMYLKMLNLIDESGLPIFLNEADEILLNNKIKIILVTLSH